MRRPVGLILIGVGAFFLALAPLLRFYVAPQLILAPLNYYGVTRLEAANASYFDAAALKLRTGVTIAAVSTVRGDTRAGNGKVAVWDNSTEIFDEQRKQRIDLQGYRMAFDRRSAQLVNCCGSNVGGDTSVRMSGYGLLFPIANVERRDYSFYDMTTKRPLPMVYDGDDEVQGLKVYRFVQQVPNVKVEDMSVQVPGELLGLGKRSPARKVARYFAATITVWVDPRTGAPVKHRQNIRSTIQTPDGRGKLTVAAADLITTEADQRELVDETNGNALKLTLIKIFIPFGSLVGGLLMLVGGCVIVVISSRARAARQPTRRPDGRFGAPAEGADTAESGNGNGRPGGGAGGSSAGPRRGFVGGTGRTPDARRPNASRPTAGRRS